MDTPPDRPDRLEQRIEIITRSGRRVRPPVRYEPDPDQLFEDDFTDAMSETDSEWEEGWGYREEVQGGQCTDDDDQQEESGQSDFTDTESRDSSYESTESRSSDLSSTDNEDDDSERDGLVGEGEYEEENEEEEDDDDDDDEEDVFDAEFADVLEWDTLTVDASDHNHSSDDDQDDQDL